jgi:hypothetical protein
LSLLARERPIDGGKLIILIFADGGPPDSDSPRGLRIAGTGTRGSLSTRITLRNGHCHAPARSWPVGEGRARHSFPCGCSPDSEVCALPTSDVSDKFVFYTEMAGSNDPRLSKPHASAPPAGR